MNEDSLKAVYFSPSFNGISLGLSYAPNNSTDSYNAGDTSGGGNAEQLAAALSYSVDVMGGSFSANVGMESYTNDGGGDNPSAMRYGATLSIDQIGIGAVVHTQDLGGSENSYADVGIGWSQGPLMLGVQWASREVGSSDSDITALNANYNLGPGIDLGAQVGMGSREWERLHAVPARHHVQFLAVDGYWRGPGSSSVPQFTLPKGVGVSTSTSFSFLVQSQVGVRAGMAAETLAAGAKPSSRA